MAKFKPKTMLECNYCHDHVQSKWPGHFASHHCAAMGYDEGHLMREVIFFVDETEHYTRIGGDNRHFTVIELSE